MEMRSALFYIIVFAVLAVLLVVAFVSVDTRRRSRIAQEERHSHSSDAARRERKAERKDSQKGRRKRH